MPNISSISSPTDKIISNARNVRSILDLRIRPSKNGLIDAVSTHLDYCNYNPTMGLIARQQYIENPIKQSPVNFRMNMSSLKSHPTIKYLADIVDEKLDALYPKTRKIREYIIKDNRMAMDRVKPSKGYGILDKLKIFLR